VICGCEGCEYEWEEACEQVREGYHLATGIGMLSYPDEGHFGLLIVDDNGDWVMG
jgi:hypothetical protein